MLTIIPMEAFNLYDRLLKSSFDYRGIDSAEKHHMA